MTWFGCPIQEDVRIPQKTIAIVTPNGLTMLNNLSQKEREVEEVDHPPYYGSDSTYETIKVIEAWELGFNLGNTVKYISRAGKKPGMELLTDLRKAAWYLNREIENLEKGSK